MSEINTEDTYAQQCSQMRLIAFSLGNKGFVILKNQYQVISFKLLTFIIK